MATKALRQQARQWVETLESRLHRGQPLAAAEIQSARDFLRRHDFPAASDYFRRLSRLEGSLVARRPGCPAPKQNYGGRVAGFWLQVQSVFDHVLVSVCYHGEFRARRGRVKLTHRFNAAGRVDFVEMKFLRALDPRLDGAIRKLVLVRDFAARSSGWYEAEAFVLGVLPRELILIDPEAFHCPRAEIVAWLMNLGHWTVTQTLTDLLERHGDRQPKARPEAIAAGETNGTDFAQREIAEVLHDPVAAPILQQASSLRARAETPAPDRAILRYLREPTGGI